MDKPELKRWEHPDGASWSRWAWGGLKVTITTPEDVQRDKNRSVWESFSWSRPPREAPTFPVLHKELQVPKSPNGAGKSAKALGSLLLKLGMRRLRENASKWMKLLKVMN